MVSKHLEGPVLIEWLIDVVRSWVPLVVVLAVVVAPALIAVFWVSRRSKKGLDWGPRRRFLSVGISLLLVVLLVLLFSYIYDNSSSWNDWYY